MTTELKYKTPQQVNDDNLNHILDCISAEIKNLGLSIKMTYQNKFGETKDFSSLVITHPTLSDFRCEILGREWNDTSRASLWFTTQRERSLEGKPYTDGTRSTHSHKYEFEYILSESELLEIGLKKFDYRVSLNQLRVAFKATKNPKLILKDIIPPIQMYLEVIKRVSQKIDERIARENDVLELQKKVSKHSKYQHDLYDLGTRTFILDIGEVTISEYGDIELKRSITRTELLNLLGEK